MFPKEAYSAIQGISYEEIFGRFGIQINVIAPNAVIVTLRSYNHHPLIKWSGPLLKVRFRKIHDLGSLSGHDFLSPFG